MWKKTQKRWTATEPNVSAFSNLWRLCYGPHRTEVLRCNWRGLKEVTEDRGKHIEFAWNWRVDFCSFSIFSGTESVKRDAELRTAKTRRNQEVWLSSNTFLITVARLFIKLREPESGTEIQQSRKKTELFLETVKPDKNELTKTLWKFRRIFVTMFFKPILGQKQFV